MSEAATREQTQAPFWERFRSMFNKRGNDGWAIVFIYPVARLLTLPIVSVRWITPNLLTFLSFTCRLLAAWLLFFPNDFPVEHTGTATFGTAQLIVLIALLQMSVVFDCMDGTLARVRKSYSLFGAFLDKVTDAIGLFLVFAAVGWIAANQSGNAWWIIVGCAGGATYTTLCYMHWVVEAIAKPRAKPSDTALVAPIPTWSGIGKEWIRGWLKMPLFQEADLYLWMSVFAVLDQFEVLAAMLAGSQVLGLLIRLVTHSQTLLTADAVARKDAS